MSWECSNRNITEKRSHFWILHLLSWQLYFSKMNFYAIVDGGKNIKTSRVAKVLGWVGSEESVRYAAPAQHLNMIVITRITMKLSWWWWKEGVTNSNLRELYSILAKSEKWPLEKWLIRPEKVTGTKAPLAPWHVWRPIWVHFSPWGPIFPVKNWFS